VLYSVVLGFLVGTVWTSFSTAQQTSDLEAGYVADAFNVAGQLRPPQQSAMQRLIAQYAIDVADTPWTAQSSHRKIDQTILNRAIGILTTLPGPAKKLNDAEVLRIVAIRGSLLESFRRIADTRRLRLVQSNSRLPAGMLFALLLGAMFVITFTFFFGVRSYAKQMTMTALLAGSIGLFFGLVVVLSTPYSGPVQVSRDAWNFVIDANHLRDYAK
jgi:hypothetical protein